MRSTSPSNNQTDLLSYSFGESMPLADLAPFARDMLFYQKRKKEKRRLVSPPKFDAPIADTHAHLDMLGNPALALAEVLEAELACSRPLAEGSNWMPRDRYLGVSGKTVAPELYVAAGISGQIHHSAGVNRSQVIVAINDDEEAPIFEQADYAVVGDLYAVLPQLTELLK